jgi:hypothetical protein
MQEQRQSELADIMISGLAALLLKWPFEKVADCIAGSTSQWL